MRKILAVILCLTFCFYSSLISFASGDEWNDAMSDADNSSVDTAAPEINAKAAVLMDADTGTVLFTKNAAEALPPASVTKVMTLLLVAEAIASGEISLDDKVVVSANAASMGGSQIFIKEGERFTVEELLKSAIIASANDASVALAELLGGSEDSFVEKMNKRAAELGMKNTNFENATGLDDTVVNHTISAYDIALMSRELLKHDIVTKYSRIWQDSIRDGEFILTNTNRLVRFYDGCTGLKTGSTDKAGFCISATAKRGGMHLIAVIMGAETRDERNNAARALLDYGFAAFALYSDNGGYLEDVPVRYGEIDNASISSQGFYKIINKSDKNKVEKSYSIPETLRAPVRAGDKVGEIVYTIGAEEIGRCDIVADASIDRLNVFGIYWRLIKAILVGKESNN